MQIFKFSIKEAISYSFQDYFKNFKFYIKLFGIALFCMAIFASALLILQPNIIYALQAQFIRQYLFPVIIFLFALALFLFVLFLEVPYVYQATAISHSLHELYYPEGKFGNLNVDNFFKFMFNKQVQLFILARCLYILAVIAGCAFFILPGIYLRLRYYFVGYSILDQNLSLTQDWRYSSQLTKNIKLKLLVVVIILDLINLLSFLSLIGSIFMPPFYQRTASYIYKKSLDNYKKLRK